MTSNNFLNDGKEEEDCGRASAKAGLLITDCPYPKGSFASYDWIIGWNDEKYQMEHRKEVNSGS